MVKESKKLKRKKESPKGKPPQKRITLSVELAAKQNHSEGRCWNGAGAHLKPKRTRQEDTVMGKLSRSQGITT